MKSVRLIICALSCFLISHSAFAKVYKWTDDKGLTHFGEHPPSNQSNEVIKPKTGHSDPVTYATPAETKTPETKNASQEEVFTPVKDPERCAAARKNQEILKSTSRVRTKDDKGEYRYLNEQEVKQKIDEANKAISESC